MEQIPPAIFLLLQVKYLLQGHREYKIKDIASTDTQGSVSRDPRSENYPMKLQGIHMQDPNLSRLGFLVRNWAMGRWLARFTPQKCPRHHLSSPDGLPGGEEERSPRHPAVTAGGAAGQVR